MQSDNLETSNQEYFSSKETKKELKIQDCDLAHIRNSGKLLFTKKGNAYLYSKDSIEEYKRTNRKN